MPEITGVIQDEREGLYVGPFQFENLDSPCAAGVRVNGPAITDGVTESDGSLPEDFSLAPGRTRLVINGRKSKPFTVPIGSGPYDLATLMATASLFTTRTIVTAATIENLEDYPSTASNFIALVIADANGAFAIFKWDSEATNANDGASYVRPFDFTAAGLWVRIL